MKQAAYSRDVVITYKLSGAPAIITLAIETNGVAIPDSAVTRLSGDVCKMIEGDGETKSSTWNAGVDWPDNITDVAVARVTAWLTDSPPQYCAVDVSGGSGASSYPVYYYPSAEGVPNGVTDDLYKIYRILLRRIEATPAAGFMMGAVEGEVGSTKNREVQANVILTKPYYIGVYPVTQQQWWFVTGTSTAKFTQKDCKERRPVENVTYLQLRDSGVFNGANDTFS